MSPVTDTTGNTHNTLQEAQTPIWEAAMFGGKIGVPVLLVLFAFHFTPLIVAIVRHHRAKLAIGVTNVLLGWTIIGWIVALIWACNSNVEPA